MKYRYPVALLIAGALAVASCLYVVRAPTNRVTVVNASGRPARAVSVTVCGSTTHLGDIPPGGSTGARFGTPSGDDYIGLHGRLSDGTSITEPHCVYVVWEDYFRHFTIVIREDGTTTGCD